MDLNLEIIVHTIASKGFGHSIVSKTVRSIDRSDRLVWRYAQKNQMMILTANRNMKGDNSLEQVMHEENTADSFPVLTIADIDRLDEFDYRERCVERLVEIVIDVDNYMGVGRLFIP